MDFDIPEVNIQNYRTELDDLNKKIQDESQAGNYEILGDLNARLKELEAIVYTHTELHSSIKQYQENLELIQDPDFSQVATEENEKLLSAITELSAELETLILPPLPADEKNAIVEIRAGTGGTEAALFAAEVHRMYLRYVDSIGFKSEQLSTSYSDEGGIKETVFRVKGEKAYGKIRFESGVHRVQRVPSTESSGRIHTSAISIVVMPEIETKDVNINDSDLKIETFRSSGPGGQSVNTTDSAVRITHIPTGITVSCQDGKSQHKNKEQALSILASKLHAKQIEEQEAAANSLRSSAIMGGDRSAKIRTFNFPQGRVTDHRIKQSWYNLTEVLEGNLEEIVSTVNSELRKEFASEPTAGN